MTAKVVSLQTARLSRALHASAAEFAQWVESLSPQEREAVYVEWAEQAALLDTRLGDPKS
ncbi:MAG: hypothetical protein ACREXP_19880 [Steroidobacteraceae bacterium]